MIGPGLVPDRLSETVDCEIRDLSPREGPEGAVKGELPEGEGAVVSGEDEALADRTGLIVTGE